jgi:DNA-binding Xre family transcriptional regulator
MWVSFDPLSTVVRACFSATRPFPPCACRGPSDLRSVGHLLITSRIAQGISQRELARRLGVHESQVSRDERNEYFGITLERAAELAKILDVLNVRLHTGSRSNRCRRLL